MHITYIRIKKVVFYAYKRANYDVGLKILNT